MNKYLDVVMTYAEKLASGKTKANKYRVKAAKRFLKDLKNPKYELKTKDADFCITIIETTICHFQGEKIDGTPLKGTPFLLTDFHKFIIYNLLGFYLKGTNIRRFKEAFIYIPRKILRQPCGVEKTW